MLILVGWLYSISRTSTVLSIEGAGESPLVARERAKVAQLNNLHIKLQHTSKTMISRFDEHGLLTSRSPGCAGISFSSQIRIGPER